MPFFVRDMVVLRSILHIGIYFVASSYFLHAKKDDGMANNFSSRGSFELIFLPTGSYSSG